MCNKKELSFSIFMIYSLADKWKMSPAKVYRILNATGILEIQQFVRFNEEFEKTLG